MKKNHNDGNKIRNKNVMNIYNHMLVNLTISYLICSAICLFIFILNSNINSNYFLILTVLSLTVFITAYRSGIKFRKKGIIVGVVYNLPFILSLIAISVIINSFVFDYRMFVSIISLIIFSALGGIVSVNTRKK